MVSPLVSRNSLALCTALVLSCSMIAKANDSEKSASTTSNNAPTSTASDTPSQKTANNNDSAASTNSKGKVTVFEKVKKDPKKYNDAF